MKIFMKFDGYGGWEKGKVLSLEEAKLEICNDIDNIVSNSRDEKDYKKIHDGWMRKKYRVLGSDENHLDGIREYCEGIGFELLICDDIVEINGKNYGFIDEGNPGTMSDELRARNFGVYNLSDNEKFEYQFVELIDADSQIGNMRWVSRKYSPIPLDNDPNLFWHDWEHVDLSSSLEQAICNEIVKIDNRRLFSKIKNKALELLEDTADKTIKNNYNFEFSPRSYCGDVLYTIADAQFPEISDELMEVLIEFDVKPVLQVLNRIEDIGELSLDDLIILNDIDRGYGGGVHTYKGENIKVLESKNENKLDEAVVSEEKTFNPNVEKLKRLEKVKQACAEIGNKIDKMIDEIKNNSTGNAERG